MIETLDDLIGDDPLAELEAAMEAKGSKSIGHRRHPCTSTSPAATPSFRPLEAVGLGQEHDGIVVWATTEQGRWACVAWRAPDMVSVFNLGPHERWRHQRLPSSGPAGAANALNNATPQ